MGFAAETHAFGGMIGDGESVVVELGHFAAVDPSCRFVVADPYDGSIGTALAGELTSEQASTLTELLALDELDDLAEEYGRPCGTDGTTSRFAWGDRRLRLVCSGTERVRDDVRDRFLVSAREIKALLKTWGEPVSGPLRYVLVEGWNDPRFDGAREWPLDASPDVLAERVFDPDSSFDLGEPRVWTTDGEDASRLRSLREAWLAGRSDEAASRFLPIEAADGSRFALYMRDVVEFEMNTRAFVPWATDGSLVVEANASTTTSGLGFAVSCGANDATHTVEGRLEVVSEKVDSTHWKGTADGLPPGHCAVRLTPIAPDDASRCKYGNQTGPVPVIISAGWSAGLYFRCR